MKFLHLGDLHLGIRVHGFDLLEDQQYILDQIVQIAKDQAVNGVLICGDVYDTAYPPAQAVTLLNDFLNKLVKEGIEVFVISGNHDSAVRLGFGSELMKASGVHMSTRLKSPLDHVDLTGKDGEKVRIHMMPFIRPVHVRPLLPDQTVENWKQAYSLACAQADLKKDACNILMSHQFVTGATTCQSEELMAGGIDQVSALDLEPFDYTALGHLHSPQQVTKETIRYSGSPLAYSTSEIRTAKSVPVIKTQNDGSVRCDSVELHPLHGMREIEGHYEQIVKMAKEHPDWKNDYISVILDDEQDVPDALFRLQSLFPFFMKMEYAHRRPVSTLGVCAEKLEALSDLDLIASFFKDVTGANLSKEQQELITGVWEDLDETR